MKASMHAKKQYTAPALVTLGSLHQLTLQVKSGARCDVSCFHHGSMSVG